MTTSISATSRKTTTSKSTSNPVLHYGAHGAAVTRMQQALKAAGYNPKAVDGGFGAHTLAALKKFQAGKRLAADGVCGPKTWAALAGGKAQAAQPGKPPDTFVAPGGTRKTTGYVNGRATTITLAKVSNGKEMRVDAAAAFNKMAAAAKRAGITLSVNSGFRTMAQQQVLYNNYLHHRGASAAKPGYSNHQGGLSADIHMTASVSRWLKANAASYGFKNDVKGEAWHWTFKG